MIRSILATLGLALTLTVPALAQPTASDLQAVLDEIVPADQPGIAAQIRGPGGMAAAAAGLADLETGAPVTVDSPMRIASATKTFVATLVLLLVEEGRIDLDAPAARYVEPEVIRGVANADRATVRQLLNMTSGIEEFTDTPAFDRVFTSPAPFAWSARAALAMAAEEPALSPPGTAFHYSNTNYILLQLIIEAVTGQPLAPLLKTRIFEPLGMTHTFLEPTDRVEGLTIRGYEARDDGEWEDVTDENDGIGLGDGGIVSTARDLSLFLPALFKGRLITETTLREEMLDYVEDPEGGSYGLGIGTQPTEAGLLIGHDGIFTGFSSRMVYLPDRDLSIALLSNDLYSDPLDEVVEWVLETP